MRCHVDRLAPGTQVKVISESVLKGREGHVIKTDDGEVFDHQVQLDRHMGHPSLPIWFQRQELEVIP